MAERVTVTIDNGIADVRLNRPDKLNALDPPLLDALVQTGERLGKESSVRAVVLSGEGRGFCAGLDASSLGAIAGGSADASDPDFADAYRRFAQAASSIPTRLEGKIANLFQQSAQTWVELEVPVIAACQGPVLGGGLQIALGADIRFTTADAKWSVLEIRWGLLPDMTGIPQLIRLVGLDVAKELAFTGRMITGTQAVELGIATHVSDDPHSDAMDLARELCDKNPDAIRGMKALFNAAAYRAPGESYLEESRLMAGLIAQPNQIEATMAYLEKRKPNFVNP